MKKELIPTIIGVSLPILMILGVTAYVYVLQNIPFPNQNLVFTAKQYDECTRYLNKISLEPNGKIETVKDRQKDIQSDMNPNRYDPCEGRVVIQKENPDVYVYDFKTEKVKLITIEDLSKQTIKTGVSDEGYYASFSRDFTSYGPMEIFYGSGSMELYIKKDKKVRKLNTDSFPNLDYQYGVSIIGWIK